MRLGFIGVAALVCMLAASAYADPWKASEDANLTLAQNQYSNNWVGGTVGTIAWVFNSNSLAERQFNPKLHNKTTLLVAYGQSESQSQDTRHWAKPVKSTDKIEFETVFRLTFGGWVDPFASGRIETEFIDLSDPALKRGLNPALFIESAGIAKVLSKADKREWTMRLGGAFRQNMNRHVLNPVTLERKTNTTNDGGILYVNEFTSPISGNRMTVTSRLSVYQAFFNSKAKEFKGLPNENFWKAPDVNLENTFTANITKYVMVNLYIQILYDKEVSLGGRFQQTLALGLTYKWSR
jgi:hypothetical protein